MDIITLAAAKAYTNKVALEDGAVLIPGPPGPPGPAGETPSDDALMALIEAVVEHMSFDIRRVSAVSTSRTLLENRFAPIRHTHTDGDTTMTDGENFIAPVDGLYVFSSTLSRVVEKSVRQDAVLSKNGTSTEAENVLTQVRFTTPRENGNATVSVIPAITHLVYLKAGETVAFSLRSQAAQPGFASIEFEFFLVGAAHNGVSREEFEELKERIVVKSSTAEALEYSNENPTALVFFPEGD